MKHLILALIVSAPGLAFATDKTTVDNSRGPSDGIVEIDISGGKGSAAEKLYQSLTLVPEVPDDAMGDHHGTAKQAKAIDCSVENDSHVKDAYTCIIKISPAGESLEPWK